MRHRIGLLWVLAGGCDPGAFTVEETQLLQRHLAGPRSASPSNRWADDPAAAELGHKLFFDDRFSGEPTRVACAGCHDPANGGSDQRSIGGTSVASGWTGRNAPTVLNVALAPSPWFFWDGRTDSLWAQALGPIESPNEHNFTRLETIGLVRDQYRDDYEAVFGPLPPAISDLPPRGKPGDAAFDGLPPKAVDEVNLIFSHFGKAIEAYERQLTDGESPFTRYLAGSSGAMSPSAVRGAKLFVGRASCNECHSGPHFSDGKFHNNGVPQEGPKVPLVDPGRAAGVPKVLANVFNGAGAYSDAVKADWLTSLSSSDADLGAFKTPTLRNIARTGPYMHTGAFATLWDVLVWYRGGGEGHSALGASDPRLRPLRLSDDDLIDLLAFLEALSSEPLPAALVSPI